MPYFDSAVTSETQHRQSLESIDRPTNAPRSLRKPPSLSTLAMPNFSNMRPPSDKFVDALRSLIAALPQENRDLLRTITEVIKTTAQRHKQTKMPLSNLLLLFCPSTNMSPPLLRAFCEAEDIWDGHANPDEVIDLKRQLTVKASNLSRVDSSSSSSANSSLSSSDGFEDALSDNEGGNNRNTIVSDYAKTPTLETAVVFEPDADYGSRQARPRGGARRGHISTVYLDTASADDLSLQSFGMPDEVKTSLAQSLSYDRSSNASPVSPDISHPFSPPSLSSSIDSLTSSEAPSSSHLPLSASTSSRNEYASIYNPSAGKSSTLPSQLAPTQSTPNVSEFGVVQFPSTGSPPITPMKNRPSIAHMTTTPIISSSSPPSIRTQRLKKPSLHLLFSRKSSASLNGLSISAPMPYEPQTSSGPPSPESWRSSEPPVLDLAMETGPLDLKQYLAAEEKRRTMTAARHKQVDSFYTARETPSPSEGSATPSSASQDVSPATPSAKETPIADLYSTPCSSVTSLHDSQNTRSPRARPRPQPSQASLASKPSINHLSMALPDESLIEDDWAQSVITATDTNADSSWKNVLKLW